MTNTSKKGRWMFAGFVAIIVTVFSCLLAFLIVTILPKVKTHSNYYLLKETTEETESTGPSLDDLVNSKTELYFSGDKYYIKETLGTESERTDPEDYVIYDGRIYFDISQAEFDKATQEERNLLPSYKITADKVVMEDGEFVCESNQKMFLTGIIGLGVSLFLSLVVVSMIISYNKQMRAVSKEISQARAGGASLKEKVKALPTIARLIFMLILTACLIVPGALIMSGSYANHSGSYVTYMIKKTFDNEGKVNNYPDRRTVGDSHKFYEEIGSKKEVIPDIVITYTFKGKKLIIKTETVSNVTYEEHDYIIKDVGMDLEEKFGRHVTLPGLLSYDDGYEDTRVFVDTTEAEYDEYIEGLRKLLDDPDASASLDSVSTPINTLNFYLQYKELEETYHTYGAYSTNYWAIHSIGIVLLILAVMCLIRLLVLIRDCVSLIKNRKAPATQTAGVGAQSGETTSAEVEAGDSATAEKVEEKKAQDDKSLQRRQRIVFLVMLAIVAAVVLFVVL